MLGTRRPRIVRAFWGIPSPSLRVRIPDGHLIGVVSEYVAQDEHGELASWQDPQCGHEGQGDGFGLFVAGLRAERQVNRALEEGVGIWLEPHDVAEPGRLGRFNPVDVPLHDRGDGWPSEAR